MSEQSILHVTTRPQTGSNKARQMRSQGRLPGVLYGHGEPLAISLDAHEFTHTIASSQYGSQVVRINLDGEVAGNALVKAVQVNTLVRRPVSVDLQRVSSTDRVTVSVSVVLTGEPTGARVGGVLEQTAHAVTIRVGAMEVPEELTFDISAMAVGDMLYAAQLALPLGSELAGKGDELIATLGAPTVQVEEEPVVVEPGEGGPDLTGEKQQDDSPPER